MSDRNSNAAAGPSKAVASLAAKKPTGSGPKLKFVPTLPVRRKKDEVKQEPAAPSLPAASTSTERGRGRGRGDASRGGRGRGRGTAPGPPAAQMTASGPFAMGPSAAGSSGWRTSAPRANATPIVPAGGPKPVTNLTQSAPPSLKRERSRQEVPKEEDDEEVEVYSDPDEGVEIVDMQNVRAMDWMAPETLKKEKPRKKKTKVKRETEDRAEQTTERMEVDSGSATPAPTEADVDVANAIDLDESEEEEEMEDFIEDFISSTNPGEEDVEFQQERLFLFQFPSPFPKFSSKPPTAASGEPPADAKGKAPEKRVSFAQGTKPDPSTIVPKVEPEEKQPEFIDGAIGQLEMYRSGAVKMRLANGILLDISPGTQPSFLQQAVHVDPSRKQIHVLGEISRRFVATPDIETLLDAMAQADVAAAKGTPAELEGLIAMDTS